MTTDFEPVPATEGVVAMASASGSAEAPPVAKVRDESLLAAIGGPLLVFCLFVGLWYFMALVGIHGILNKPKFLVPKPDEVVRISYFRWRNLHPILDALRLTTKVALIGLVIAIVIGIVSATVMSQARWLERALWPYAIALQAVPILALVPLIGIIFGYGTNARVIVCVIISLFPIITNTLFGLLSADRGQHELFTLSGVSRWTRLTKLQFPAALPAIFTGFRISAGLSVIGAVVGDLFFQRGDQGLGQLIKVYAARIQYPQMYGALVVTVLLGIAVFAMFGWLSNRAVGHWHQATRNT